MVLDFAAALCYIGIVWLLGQWTAGRLFAQDKARRACLLSFAIGFSELTLLSTFLYFTCRMPVQAVRIVWILLGCAAFVGLVRRGKINKESLAVLGGILGLWLVMLLPGFIGRDQYYVYRGNCTDQQTYVEETVALSMHPIGWYESRTREEIELVSDVLWRGYRWAVVDRPSAGMMIAVMRANPSGEIYWVVYLYRMFVLSMSAASLYYLFAVVTNCGENKGLFQKVVWILAAVLYGIGFWGQIQYDIDAVSQLSSIAVFTALTALFIQYTQKLAEGQKQGLDTGPYAAMILLASAGLAIYLESALVHGALYFVAGILFLLRVKGEAVGRRQTPHDAAYGEKPADAGFRGSEDGKPAYKRILWLAGIPVISLGALILTNYRIVHFLFAQINSSVSDTRQSWANYFNGWWLGRHGIDDGRITGPVSALVNHILSASGMYNMTVNYERYYGIAALVMTGAALLLAALAVFCMIRPLFGRTKRPLWALWVITITGIGIVIGMCAGGKNWSAGKLLYYISPYLYAFLCSPALHVKSCRGISGKMSLFLAAVLMISNMGMVASRCKDVQVNWAGLGYRGNYPSDMIPGLKMEADFNFDTTRLKGYDGVKIGDLSMVSDYQFYLQYLKVKLTCAQIPWTAEKDVNYYQEALDFSQYRELTGNVAVAEAVRDADGRYRIEIR